MLPRKNVRTHFCLRFGILSLLNIALDPSLVPWDVLTLQLMSRPTDPCVSVAAVVSEHNFRRFCGRGEPCKVAKRVLSLEQVEVSETALGFADLPVDFACRFTKQLDFCGDETCVSWRVLPGPRFIFTALDSGG